jgi:hypothetical protein
MKLMFEVWCNAKGEVHLTCEDKQLLKPINIRAKDGLESTRVLTLALGEATPAPVAEPAGKYQVGKRIRFPLAGHVYLITAVDRGAGTVSFAYPADPEDCTTETMHDLDRADVEVLG